MAGFWADPSIEPKRKFRWLLSVGGAGDTEIPQWVIKKVTKPTISVSEIKHSFINHSFYYPGRVEYNEIEFTLVDPVSPTDVSDSLINIILGAGYALPDTELNSYAKTITKGQAVTSLEKVIIRQIAAADVADGASETDDVQEAWELTNAWVKEVNFGDLDYESDDIVEITVKLRYDWAEKIV